MDSRLQENSAQDLSGSRTGTLQYTLLGVLAGILFPLVATVIKAFELHLPPSPASIIAAQQADPLLWIIDSAPFFLGLVAHMAGRRQDMALQANKGLAIREAELTAIRGNLEQIVSERTEELDRRNAQTRAVIEFVREIADIQDLPSLTATAVDFLAARFGIPDASLFLLDRIARYAELRASSSSEGRKLLNDGFRVDVGDQSPVGRVVRRGKLIVSSPDRGQHGPHSRASATTEPGTRLTLPLVARGKVIGALDLQSAESRPIGHAQTEILQVIASQLAAAIENVRLVTETRATLDQLSSLTSQDTRAAWQEYLKSNDFAFEFTPAGIRAIPSAPAAHGSDALNAPVILRGQKIGTIALHQRTGGSWGRVDRELVEKVSAQVALALENVRLLEQTRQRAAQEQLIGEISARLARSLDVDAVLQAAVREFAALPDVAEAEILLTPSGDSGSHALN